MILFDNISIENNEGWFIGAENNILFKTDMSSGIYEYITELPLEFSDGMRKNPNCIKCDNLIYCLPDNSKIIWIYDTESKNLDKIEFDVCMGILCAWQQDNFLILYSHTQKKIITLDIKEKRINKIYDLLGTECDSLEYYAFKYEDFIYFTSAVTNIVYEFSIANGQTKKYELPVNDKIYGIVCDEKNFWIGSYKKIIYKYDREFKIVKVINEFPENFGVYDFSFKLQNILDCKSEEYENETFGRMCIAGNKIWFIPFQTNYILYMEKDSDKLNVFEIAEEEESRNALGARALNHKYLLEYVWSDRFIGLYSIKNQCIYEIDAKNLMYNQKIYELKADNKLKLYDIYKKNRHIMKEISDIDRELFYTMLNEETFKNINDDCVGEKIYNNLKQLLF